MNLQNQFIEPSCQKAVSSATCSYLSDYHLHAHSHNPEYPIPDKCFVSKLKSDAKAAYNPFDYHPDHQSYFSGGYALSDSGFSQFSSAYQHTHPHLPSQQHLQQRQQIMAQADFDGSYFMNQQQQQMLQQQQQQQQQQQHISQHKNNLMYQQLPQFGAYPQPSLQHHQLQQQRQLQHQIPTAQQQPQLTQQKQQQNHQPQQQQQQPQQRFQQQTQQQQTHPNATGRFFMFFKCFPCHQFHLKIQHQLFAPPELCFII